TLPVPCTRWEISRTGMLSAVAMWRRCSTRSTSAIAHLPQLDLRGHAAHPGSLDRELGDFHRRHLVTDVVAVGQHDRRAVLTIPAHGVQRVAGILWRERLAGGQQVVDLRNHA